MSPGKYTYKNAKGAEVSFQGFSGYSELNMPKLGILQNFDIATSALLGVQIGYCKGDELPDWPVSPDRYYFYMSTVNLIDASAADGKVNFSLGYTACALQKMALDVTDPFIYARVDVEKLGGCPVLKEAGMGFSVQGNLAFRVPEDLKYGNVKDFDGQLLLEAKIDVKDLVDDLPLPFLIDGRVIYAFDKRQPNAGAEFLDNKKVPFMIGGLGSLTVDATGGYVPGLSLEIELGDAAFSAFYKDKTSWEASFVGAVNVPPVQPGELIAEVTGVNNQYLKYIKISSITAKMWGTFGSDPTRWAYGWSLVSEIYFGLLPAWSQESSIEFSSNHVYYMTKATLANFVEAGIKGELKSNGNFRLEGWVGAHKDFHAGPLSLKIDFDANAVVWLEYPVAGFELHGRFYGKACCTLPPWGGPLSYDACVSVEIKFDATVNTNGEFDVKAKIGIDGFGFNVTMHFSNNKGVKVMETEQIPYDQVPENQRYFSEDYLKTHPNVGK